MSTLCSCGAPITDDAFLCTAESRALHTTLTTSVPSLLEELQTAVTRGTAMPASAIGGQACDHAGDCGCGVSLPWDDHASRVADALQNALTTWALALDEEVRGLFGTLTASGFLAHNLEHLRHRPWAHDAYADITRRTEDGWSAVDRPEDRLYAGPCGATRNGENGPERCARRLWAGLEQSALRCPACGTTHIVADRQALMLSAASGMDLTAPEIASALTLMLRRRVSASTIRSWAHRGQLAAQGRDVADRALYRVGDVLELVRRGEPIEPEKASAAS